MINQFDEHEWHNGGDLFFGADSFLYVCNGDEGDLVNFTTTLRRSMVASSPACCAFT